MQKHYPPLASEAAAVAVPDIGSMADNWMRDLPPIKEADVTTPPESPAKPAGELPAKPAGTEPVKPAEKAAGEAAVASPAKPAGEAKPGEATPAPTAAEAKPAPANPAVESDEIDKKFPDVASPRAKDFKALKTSYKEARQAWEAEKNTLSGQIAELGGKMKELEAKPPPKPTESLPADVEKINGLQAKLKELTDAIIVADVTTHPDFIRHYDGRRNALVAEAKKLFDAEKGAQLEKLLVQPDSETRQAQLDELAEDIASPLARARLADVLRDLDKVNDDRTAAIAEAGKLREKVETEKLTKADQAKKARDSAFDAAVKAMEEPKTGNPLFQKRDGNEAWNKGVEFRKAFAKAILNGEGLTPEQVMTAAFAAAATPAIIQQYQASLQAHAEAQKAWAAEKGTMEAAAKKLQEKIDAMTAANPGAGQQGGPVTESPQVKPGVTPPDKAMDMLVESTVEGMRGLGMRR
jgi:hypothetical protein